MSRLSEEMRATKDTIIVHGSTSLPECTVLLRNNGDCRQIRRHNTCALQRIPLFELRVLSGEEYYVRKGTNTLMEGNLESRRSGVVVTDGLMRDYRWSIKKCVQKESVQRASG